MESAKQRGDDEARNIEWDSWREPVCSESVRVFGGDEICALEEGWRGESKGQLAAGAFCL
jgi:hypothetical protein